MLEINAKEITCNSSGGSDIFAKGTTSIFKANVNGGSDIKAKELKADICTIEASGESDTVITAYKEISINANSSSDIYYYGDPQVRNINSSGGSDVIKK